MKPAAFQYFRASTTDEALDRLAQHPGSKVLAGGQSLVPLMNFRLSRPDVLIDINGVADLGRLAIEDGELRIGALVRHRQLAESGDVAGAVPVLPLAAKHIGHWAIRNRGTIGGSVAHADPASELPAALVALQGTVVLRSARGERRVAAEEFFQGFFNTDLGEGELIVEVRIPISKSRFGFNEVVRRPGDFALVGAYVERSGPGGSVTWFGLGGRPERLLVDAWPQDASGRRALLDDLVDGLPLDVSEDYKRAMAVTVAERAYQQAEGEK